MDGVILALLLRYPAMAVIAVLWFFCVILSLRWLYPRLPKSRVVDFLFKERGNRAPDYGPGYSPSMRRSLASIRAEATGAVTEPTVPGPRGNIG